MNRPARIKTRLLLSRGPLSSLGGIKLAGTVRSSQGAGRPKKRDLGSHALVYLLAGEGVYEDAAGGRRPVGAGDLIWLFPGVPHAYGPPPGGRWDEIYLLFEGPFVELWRRQGIVAPARPVWHLEPVDYWLGRLEAVASSSAAEGRVGDFRQLSRFQSLVADMLLASRGAEDGASGRGWLARACRHLEREGAGAGMPDLEEAARAAGMSYESFRKKFARRMGMAPAKYRQARRIERACELLMRPGRPHKEIAAQLGFCDEFHFSKAFRQRMGFSPHAFRLKTLGRA